MHVFCPDCNAEYKVDERSSLTKTVKFVCVECESSWIDKFEKLEPTKELVTASQNLDSDVLIDNKNKDIGTSGLNSLALEEVQNSFGNKKNRIEAKIMTLKVNIFLTLKQVKQIMKLGAKAPQRHFQKLEVTGSPLVMSRSKKEMLKR